MSNLDICKELCNKLKEYYDLYAYETCKLVFEDAKNSLDELGFRIFKSYADDLIGPRCPREGEFIGYKKGFCFTDGREVYKYDGKRIDYNFNITELAIITLEIPSDAQRVGCYLSSKCRCNKAKVVDIQRITNLDEHLDKARSLYYPKFIYEVGKTITVDDFEDNPFIKCAPGIHFFKDKCDAYAWIV